MTVLARRFEEAVGIAGAVALFSVFTVLEATRPKVLLPFELASTSSNRLPGAFIALLGIAAVYALLARVVDHRAGTYAAAVLATTPSWFVHARTLTGTVIPMTASAVILTAFYISVVDVEAHRIVRAIAFVVATLAGAILVRTHDVGTIAAAVSGVAAAAWFRDRKVVAAVLAAIALGLLVFLTMRTAPRSAGSFDVPVTQSSYALAPWIPFVPFALARRPRSAAQVAACVSAIGSIVLHAYVAPVDGSKPILVAPFVALAVGTMLRELDETESTSALLAASMSVVGLLVANDLGLGSDRILLGFGIRADASSTPAIADGAKVVRAAIGVVVVSVGVALLLPIDVLRKLRLRRGALLVVTGVIAGVVVRSYAWTAVLSGLSPGAAVETYVERRKAGEPLAALGVDPRAMSHALGTDVTKLANADAAEVWLDEETGGRRFVAVATRELMRLNAIHRERHRENIPVLAGTRDAVVLVGTLSPGERSESLLDTLVRSDVPSGLRATGAVLAGGAVDVVGWEVAESSGRRQRIRVYLRAHARSPLRGHCSFIHVDHTPTRFSSEHLDLAYPVEHWRDGDVVVDEFAITLPPQFTRGSYELLWGAGVLPCHDDRRMPVTSGPHDTHQRIPLGKLEVR